MRRKNKMDMSITEQIESVRDSVCHEICKYYNKGKSLEGEEADEYFRDHCQKCPIIEL